MKKHGSIKIENDLSTREIHIFLHKGDGSLLTGINVEIQAATELMQFFFIAVNSNEFKGQSSGKLTDNEEYESEALIEVERLSDDMFDLSFVITKTDKKTRIKEEFRFARSDIQVEHIWLIIKIFCPLLIPLDMPKGVTLSWNCNSEIPVYRVDASSLSLDNLIDAFSLKNF